MIILPIPERVEHGRAAGPPLAVWVLLTQNLAVFATGIFLAPRVLIERYAFVPASWSIASALSSMFVHAGFWHLAGNMFFLWVFGTPVERRVGHARFLAAYLLAGLAGAAVYAVTTSEPQVRLVGASGAISGAVGLYLMLFPRARVNLHIYLLNVRLTSVPSTAIIATAVWFAEQFVLALLMGQVRSLTEIAYWAHIGGFVCGTASGLLLRWWTPRDHPNEDAATV